MLASLDIRLEWLGAIMAADRAGLRRAAGLVGIGAATADERCRLTTGALEDGAVLLASRSGG